MIRTVTLARPGGCVRTPAVIRAPTTAKQHRPDLPHFVFAPGQI